jgi:nicotinamide-nucleotide adenylyltransferase
MRGFVIGRFQPFHLGHRHLIEHIDDRVDRVIVGIGSADRSHSASNPLTSGERVRVVQDALDEMDARTYLIPIVDVDRDAMWVRHLETVCPAFDVAFTNNPFVERLFAEAGYEVRGTTLHNREEYRGAEIRRRMLEGEPWEHLVPDVVASDLADIGVVDRLGKVAATDEPDDAEGLG